MPDVLGLVDRDLLERPPPRRLPLFFVPNLVGEYLLERPARTYLDPFILAGLAAGLALLIGGAGPALWALLALLVAARLTAPIMRLAHAVREDYRLLRHGVLVQAHVLGVRPCRDAAGGAAGAYIDCVIPITRRRTSVGSVWMPDAAEALRIGAAGSLPVICLAHAPGTWRLRDGDGPRLRYEVARR